jgi:hypothetical protein
MVFVTRRDGDVSVAVGGVVGVGVDQGSEFWSSRRSLDLVSLSTTLAVSVVRRIARLAVAMVGVELCWARRSSCSTFCCFCRSRLPFHQRNRPRARSAGAATMLVRTTVPPATPAPPGARDPPPGHPKELHWYPCPGSTAVWWCAGCTSPQPHGVIGPASGPARLVAGGNHLFGSERSSFRHGHIGKWEQKGCDAQAPAPSGRDSKQGNDT